MKACRLGVFIKSHLCCLLFQVLHFAGAVHCSFWEASFQECHCERPCPCQVGVNQLLPEQVFSQRMFQIRPANCKWNVKWTLELLRLARVISVLQEIRGIWEWEAHTSQHLLHWALSSRASPAWREKMNSKNRKEIVPVMQSKGDDKCSFRCNLKLIIFVSLYFPMKIKKKKSVGWRDWFKTSASFLSLGRKDRFPA